MTEPVLIVRRRADQPYGRTGIVTHRRGSKKGMRFFPIAALVLGSLPAHGHAEALLRSVAIDNQLGLNWTFNTGGSYVTWQIPGWQMTQVTDIHAGATSSAKADAIQSANNSLDAICETLQSSASANDLPLTFLTRLIWQESRFDAYAVSPAGARGIAQFMPGTAAWVGLQNPFEVSDAIRKSAEFLQDLDKQFGNLGLAAAAYNAGPKRVQDWLANRRDLPAQTQVYVHVVTGRTVDDWRSSRSSELSPIAGETLPCLQLANVLAEQSASTATAGTQASTASATLHEPAWGVQLLGNSSRVSVLAAYRQLQARYKSVLGQRQPLVIPTKVGRTGYWYRVRVAVESFLGARKLCSSLRDLGGSCLVQRN
jgi:Transglycosylase SLT domain/SPOR domain